MAKCVFCEIAAHRLDAVRLHEDEVAMVFLDRSPIRPGHAQILAKQHIPTFEDLEPSVAAHLLGLGQQLARRMKVVYEVDRVAFLFTGGDVAHVHAHVVPMHAKMDITSARYIVSVGEIQWSAEHLRATPESLQRVKSELAFVVDTPGTGRDG
jgi:histidine triad (HIT) family protein